MSDNVNIIVQDTINEIVVNTAVVVETIDINVQVAVDEVNIIANPNNYVVNINRIIGEQVQSDWDQNDDQEPDYIKNKPSIPSIAGLATVVYVDQQDNLKVDKVAGKGLSENDFTNTLKTKLDGIESGAQVNVNADWNATTGDAEILNKPTIPAAQVNSDWNATSGVAEILNKPTIPTLTSDLINDGEDGVNPFITAQDIPTFATADRMVTVGRNATGSTLYRGTIVYILGSTGNRPNFVKSIASSEGTSAGTFGVIENDIPNNSDGNCVTIGTIENLDTRSNATHPFTTNTLVDGDTIYLSPTNAGFITNVKPSAPDHLVYIGKVVRTSPTNGTIVYRIQNGYELQELHNVAINGVSNNQLLAYESSTSLWKNKSVTTAEIADSLNKRYVTDANLTTIGNQSGTNTGDETITTIKSKLGITTLSGSNTGDQDLSGLTPNTRSISTTTPLQGGGDLSANRTLSILQSNTTQSGFLSNTDWSAFNGKFNLPSLTSGSVLFSNGTTIAQDNANFFWDDTNNRLGIGTVAPTAKLHINLPAGAFGSGNPYNILSYGNSNIFRVYMDGNWNYVNEVIQNGVNQSGYIISTNSSERMRITSGGNVGIGTASPTARLHVAAPGALSTDIALRVRNSADTADLLVTNGLGNVGIGTAASTEKLTVWNDTAASLGIHTNRENAGDLATLRFSTVTNGDADARKKGAIFFKANGTGNGRGDMQFAVNNTADSSNAGVANAVMTLQADGNVGIGITNPSHKLDVFTSSLTTIARFYALDGTYNPRFTIEGTAEGIRLFQTFSSGASNLMFGTANTERMRINSSGNVGIGTTAPTARLHIAAPGALSTDIALRVRNSADSLNLMFVNGLGQTSIGQGTSTLTNMLTVQDVNSTSVGIELRSDQNPRVGSTFNTSRILSGYSSGTASFLDLQYAGGAYPYTYTTGLRLNSLGNILINTTTDVASSKLTIESTTQGVLFPRMTTTQKNAIATPATGLVVFDTTLNKLCVRGASAWETITSI